MSLRTFRRKAAAAAPALLSIAILQGTARAQSDQPITLQMNLPLPAIDGSPVAKNLTKVTVNAASSGSPLASFVDIHIYRGKGRQHLFGDRSRPKPFE